MAGTAHPAAQHLRPMSSLVLYHHLIRHKPSTDFYHLQKVDRAIGWKSRHAGGMQIVALFIIHIGVQPLACRLGPCNHKNHSAEVVI